MREEENNAGTSSTIGHCWWNSLAPGLVWCHIWWRAINLFFVSLERFLQKLWNMKEAMRMSDERGHCACSVTPAWKVCEQLRHTQLDHQVATKHLLFRGVKVNCVKVAWVLMLSVSIQCHGSNMHLVFVSKLQHVSLIVYNLKCHLDISTYFSVFKKSYIHILQSFVPSDFYNELKMSLMNQSQCEQLIVRWMYFFMWMQLIPVKYTNSSHILVPLSGSMICRAGWLSSVLLHRDTEKVDKKMCLLLSKVLLVLHWPISNLMISQHGIKGDFSKDL